MILIRFALVFATAFDFLGVFGIPGKPRIINLHSQRTCTVGKLCVDEIEVLGHEVPVFNCTFKKIPPCETQFIPIHLTGRVTPNFKSFHTEANVTGFGNGEIICNISNIYGSVSYIKKIVLLDNLQDGIMVRGPQFIHYGDNVKIECWTPAENMYLNISWYYNNSKNEFQQLYEYTVKSMEVTNNFTTESYYMSIDITNITNKYDGDYVCGVKDPQLQGKTFSVSVYDKTVNNGYIETIVLYFTLTFIVVLAITLVACHFRLNREKNKNVTQCQKDEEMEMEMLVEEKTIFEKPKDEKIPKLPCKGYGQLIGKGGFGTIHIEKINGIEVAVKVAIIGSLKEESRLLWGLGHKNIVSLLGLSMDIPEKCFIMEYAQGGSLHDFLKKTRIRPGIIVDWATQIASGMNYLHNRVPINIIHRDLKPKNVLLKRKIENNDPESNILKIADFGHAKEFTRTTIMSFKGTIPYMAPEILNTSKFSKASDVWSYGVLVWQLLTRHKPFNNFTNEIHILRGVGLGILSLPILSTFPEQLRALIKGCLNNDYHARPTFNDVLTSLDGIKDSSFTETQEKTFYELQDCWGEEISQ